MNVMDKYNNLRDRLYTKVKNSATHIDGFMVGMSGTDSMLTYYLLLTLSLDEDLRKSMRSFNVVGVHYMDDINVPDSFQKSVIPYFKSLTNATNIKCAQLSENADQLRWADLHMRAINQPPTLASKVPARYWVASTVNATEKALGTYSIMAKSASIEPIASLWKSEVLEICDRLGFPKEMITKSRIPDCACGREEFASENIELIDALIRNQVPDNYSLEQIRAGMKYIADTKKEYGFKQRTPFNV